MAELLAWVRRRARRPSRPAGPQSIVVAVPLHYTAGGMESSLPEAAQGIAGEPTAEARAAFEARPGCRRGPLLFRLALAGAGLAALAVAVRATLAGAYWGIGNYDEGVLLTNAHLLLRGQLPYRDFYSNYPPGIFVLLAGSFTLFGASVSVERGLGLVLHLAIATMAGRVGGRALGERFSLIVCGLVACWLSLLGMSAYAWLAGLALALSTCEVWAWARQLERSWGYVLAGVSLGVTSWFRHDLFLYFSAVVAGLAGAWLALRLWRGQRGGFFSRGSPLHGLFHVAGGALGTVALLWIPVFAVAGLRTVAHDLYFDQVGRTMPARVLPIPPLVALGTPRWSPISLPAFAYLPFPSSVVLTLLGPALALGALLWPRGAGLKERTHLIGPAALSIAVLPQMLGRTDIAHAVFAVTPALIASAVWLIGGRERRWNAARAWGLALLGAAALYLPLHDELSVDEPQKAQPYRKDMPRAGRTVVSASRARAVAFVRKHTGPDDPIFVGLTDHRWTRKNDMDLYFLSDRVGATRYMQFDPNLANHEDIQRLMIADLERTRPKVAILAPAKKSSEPNESRNAGSTLLDDYLRTHYREKGRAGSLQLMLRRKVPSSP